MIKMDKKNKLIWIVAFTFVFIMIIGLSYFVLAQETPLEELIPEGLNYQTNLYDLGEGKFVQTSSLGFINYFNGIDYKSINNTFISISEGGYDYKNKEGVYDFYVKEHSSWGDGIKFCLDEKCLIYQAQDMSYRDEDGSQDYISSIVDNLINLSENKVLYENVFQNVSLEYIAYNGLVKENFILYQLPRQPAEYLGENITLDFGGYIKHPNLDMYINNSLMSGNFKTSEKIEFRDSENNTLFYIIKPYAYDSNGSAIELEYEIKTQGQQIWFYVRTPYSWLSNSSRVYPIYIDPSEGPNSPGTVISTGSGGNWDEPNNAKTSNNFWAVAGTIVDTTLIYDLEVKIVKADGSYGSENKASGTAWTNTESYFSYGADDDLWSESWGAADISDIDFGVALRVRDSAGGRPATSRYLKATNFGFSIPGGSTIDGIVVEIERFLGFVFMPPPRSPYVDHIRITVYYTESVDTCTYSSENWDVLCSDNCTIETISSLPNNNLTLSGTGTFTILANITADMVIKYKDCKVNNFAGDGKKLMVV